MGIWQQELRVSEHPFDQQCFREELLIERVSGNGIARSQRSTRIAAGQIAFFTGGRTA
jgi:hypothetical protein